MFDKRNRKCRKEQKKFDKLKKEVAQKNYMWYYEFGKQNSMEGGEKNAVGLFKTVR